VLTFFVAGLLISCASSTSITWERIASRPRPAFSSHLISSTTPLLLRQSHWPSFKYRLCTKPTTLP
jgi:hypothetical protein